MTSVHIKRYRDKNREIHIYNPIKRRKNYEILPTQKMKAKSVSAECYKISFS